MKKLIFLLLPIFILLNIKAQPSNYIYRIENKQMKLYDELFNDSEKTAYCFTYHLKNPMNLVARMYVDDEEIKDLVTPARTLDSGENNLFISLDYNNNFFSFYSKGEAGLSRNAMISRREVYVTTFHNITYIREEKQELNEDCTTLIAGEYSKDGHTYKFEVNLEKADS